MNRAVSARVYAWRDQPPLPSTPPPGPVDVATWRLLWRVYAIHPNRVTMMARHLGLHGELPVSLTELARQHRLSRTRVVAIHRRLTAAARYVGAPRTLRPLIDRLQAVTVRYHDELSDEMVAAGLLAEPLHVASLAAIAALYGHDITAPKTLAHAAGRRLIASPAVATAVRLWRSRLVVATMIAPVTLAEVPPPPEVPVDLAGPLLSFDPRLTCSPDGTVVWRADRLSSAADIALRLLETGPQTLAGLLRAITRRYADRYAVADFKPPSVEALRAYLSAQPWAEVTGEMVTLLGPSPAPLGGVDRVFLDAFAGTQDRLPPRAEG